MFVIGLTGGIGTGKTEVTKIVRSLGAEVIGADEMAHHTYSRGSDGWTEVVAEFGEGVLAPDGEVDRSKLGAIVFQDDEARKRLNAIVHPRVRTLMEARIRELEAAGTEAVLAEVPLLIEARRQEAKWMSMIDETWVTDAPEGQVLERLRRRDGLDDQRIEDRVRSQIGRSERRAHADIVIDNSGSLEELAGTVKRLWHQRLSLHRASVSRE